MDIQPYNEQFQKVINIIESAKEHAYRKVNEELITMYRDIGEYISKQGLCEKNSVKTINCRKMTLR